MSNASSDIWANDLWERGISQLKRELDPQIFSAYIRPLQFSGFDTEGREVIILAPSLLVRNHVDKNFRERILRSLRDESSREPNGNADDLKLRLSVAEKEALSSSATQSTPYVVVKKLGAPHGIPLRAAPVKRISKDTDRRYANGLNPKYTFANFIVGNSNQFCHAAALRVAEEPGRSYNPLFIYGGVGLGKTHIMHAIGNAVLDRRPQAHVVYMSSETFTNDLIQSLRNSKMDEFKTRMRGIELLLIDDIQFMCGKERTQEEFFHTFNTLYNAKHQIVITSDKVPQEIPGLEERLQTRFSWGLTADLQAPDFETRVAILKRKASYENFEVPQDVAEYIAQNISSNVRELEGALTRLHAMSSLQKVPINLAMTESTLRPLLQPKMVRITITDIKKVVVEHFGIKVADIISKRRTKNLSFPRHIAMYLCRKHTTASYPEIGTQFGGRDHSSVIHAAHVVSTKVTTDQNVKDIVSKIEKSLLAS